MDKKNKVNLIKDMREMEETMQKMIVLISSYGARIDKLEKALDDKPKIIL